MRLKEQWKQPVSRADTWKAILLTVVLLSGLLAFGQVIFQSRFQRLSWAVLLLLSWIPAARQIIKHGWWVLWTFQGLLLAGYTFFAGGSILPHGTAASWLTAVGALLLIGPGTLATFDFRKSRTSASTDAAPPAA